MFTKVLIWIMLVVSMLVIGKMIQSMWRVTRQL